MPTETKVPDTADDVAKVIERAPKLTPEHIEKLRRLLPPATEEAA